jgi:urease accessory protein
MIRISQRLAALDAPRPDAGPPEAVPRADAGLRLVLPFDLRSRSRFRARLANGEEVGVMLARGQVLRGGDRLLTDDGRVVEVGAADEWVSTVSGEDAQLLARLAYHLGNRHVPLQIGPGWLRYGHDHVLDEMALGLGGRLIVEQAPFEPEAGAYAGGHHHTEHYHEHEHEHEHDH